jgi:hypothetical protein
MTPIDVAGDSLGIIQAVTSAVNALDADVVALIHVLVVGLCILIAVEVARGVMRR